MYEADEMRHARRDGSGGLNERRDVEHATIFSASRDESTEAVCEAGGAMNYHQDNRHSTDGALIRGTAGNAICINHSGASS